MKMFFKKIFTIWTFFWFLVVFLILFPFFWLFIQKKSWHPAAHFLNKLWGICVFGLTLVPYSIVYAGKKPDPKKTYVFAGNHQSLLDIPLVYLGMKNNFCFLGKSSLGKIPLFGYMYRNLHILVDRKSSRSKVDSVNECLKRVDQGQSLFLFPEGTITAHVPNLSEFKDGAFRIAIEKQIPIVPVTIAHNWIILPDKSKHGLIVNWHPAKMVFHDPIETQGMTMENLQDLKKNVHDIINEELKKYKTHAH
jgi:1-acyl-sn-glycerol-3-phosphate acyltransferase